MVSGVLDLGLRYLTFVIWEVVVHWADGKLLLESIDLIQEENDAGLDEPPRVADAVEKCKGFLHTVDRLIFEQKLIIFRDCDQEEDGCDIFEAMDPLLSFRSLPTNIKHSVGQVLDDEGGFGDASSLDTRAQDILVVGHVIVSSDPIDRIKVTKRVSICD